MVYVFYHNKEKGAWGWESGYKQIRKLYTSLSANNQICKLPKGREFFFFFGFLVY